MSSHPVAFPRYRKRRAFSRAVLRFLLPRLSKIELYGLEHLPDEGPIILAGNHSGMLEVLLLIAYAPRHLELIGAGDIPMDPRYVAFSHLYEYIPINRGNTDSAALRAAVGVLEQGGVLGIFPEGGIWEMERSKAQKGVSWIAGMSQVPVIPVGFGGLGGAWKRLIRFRFPRLTITFGEPIPAPDLSDRKNRKTILQEHAEQVMDGIQECIPEDLRITFVHPEYQRFELFIHRGDEDVSERIPHRDQLARFFFRPVLLDALRRNLRRKVGALEKLRRSHKGEVLADAVGEILDYLIVNPAFFTYRFGNDEGHRIADAFREMRRLFAEFPEERFSIRAEKRFRFPGDGAERLETVPAAKRGLKAK